MLNNVPVISDSPEPTAPPVIPPVTTGGSHEYVVPAGTMPFRPLTGVTVKVSSLHISSVMGRTSGTGLMVTVTVKLAPGQVPVTGVTV